MTSKLTIEQARRLRNDFECWQQDYDPKDDKEQYDMFGRGMVAMDMLIAGMYQEPVAYMWDSKRNDIDAPGFYFPEHLFFAESNVKQWGGEVIPLYRHAQQPVVPQDVLEALQKVARIRLDLNDFDGDRRGIADCLGDAEEALIEVVNRRAAMLNGGKS